MKNRHLIALCLVIVCVVGIREVMLTQAVSFSISARGSTSLITSGTSLTLTVGYARMQPAAGSFTPSGVAIFAFRRNNVLVSEASVPASPLIQSGRIYTEVGGRLNTGMAIANPNSQDAVINFHFTDTAGVGFGSGVFTLQANNQNAFFLNEAPVNGGSSIQGTLSFSSNVPISVIALRSFFNERDEFLMTTLPVVDTSLPASEGTQFLAHFADGAGLTTHIFYW